MLGMLSEAQYARIGVIGLTILKTFYCVRKYSYIYGFVQIKIYMRSFGE